jgi:penicillin-binding protein 2
MFRRRKRIPYDPPSARRKQKRRRSPTLRADQIFLTRRMLVLKGSVVTGFAALAGKLGYMQIVQGQNYQLQAEKNIERFQPMKAPRGLIFDRAGRPLAENKRTWEVRVVPADLPDDNATLTRVKETLITALRLPEALVVDPTGVPIGAEKTVYARIANLLGQGDKVQDWVDYINQQAAINALVMCEDSLTPDQAATFRAAAQEMPGVEVINILDYKIRNAYDMRQAVVIQSDVSRKVALKLEADQLYLPGVELDDSVLMRSYVGGQSMSHLLGYVGTISDDEYKDPKNLTAGGNHIYAIDDIIGKAGLELTMEPLLRGQKGGKWLEVDTHGMAQRVIPGTENPAVPGKNLKLTIDMELQQAASIALQAGIQFSNEDRAAIHPDKEFNAVGGAVVAMDVRTGEVLAMVSYPFYDNQLFIDGISVRKFNEYNQDEKRKPLTNRCVADKYPPGSTLKPFMAASALRDKVIDEGTTFACHSAIKVPWTLDESKGDYYFCWIRDITSEGHGPLDVIGALEQSCDIFFYNVGTPHQKPDGAAEYLHYYDYNIDSEQLGDMHYFEGLGIEPINKNLEKRFWFGAATGIDLPWEAPGLVPDPDWLFENYQNYWSSGDTINVSIGQGFFESTPLQIALNTASLANGGKIYKPLLVKEVVDDKVKKVQEFESQLLRDMRLNKKYLNIVCEGMRRVVHGDRGTAKTNSDGSSKWALTNPQGEPEITIAGKTGTAEFGTPDEKGSYEHQHAWFTCFAPFDNPEVAISVIVEDGGEGASYAVPVADKVMRAYFELTGKRKRGLVLREDKQPASDTAPAPDALAKTPKPGSLTPQRSD